MTLPQPCICNAVKYEGCKAFIKVKYPNKTFLTFTASVVGFQIISWVFRYVCLPVFWSLTSAVCFQSTSEILQTAACDFNILQTVVRFRITQSDLSVRISFAKEIFQAPKNKPLVYWKNATLSHRKSQSTPESKRLLKCSSSDDLARLVLRLMWDVFLNVIVVPWFPRGERSLLRNQAITWW